MTGSRPRCWTLYFSIYSWSVCVSGSVFSPPHLQRHGWGCSGWVASCQSQTASCKRWCSWQEEPLPPRSSCPQGWGRCGWQVPPPPPATARSGSEPSPCLPPGTGTPRRNGLERTKRENGFHFLTNKYIIKVVKLHGQNLTALWVSTVGFRLQRIRLGSAASLFLWNSKNDAKQEQKCGLLFSLWCQTRKHETNSSNKPLRVFRWR